MPTGRTHDQITWTCLPLIAGATFLFSRSYGHTLSLCSGFLFSGLMFGPDLDIYSTQFKRWGLLRVIWLPYQKGLRHRSWLSHGPIIGTALRLVYLGLWVGLVGGVIAVIAHSLWGVTWSWQDGVTLVQHSWRYHMGVWLAMFAGLELGAMSHSLSDWLDTIFKIIFFKLRHPFAKKRRTRPHHRH